MIVAPSLVMVVLPPYIILSIPLGPKVGFTISEIEFTAFIFETIYDLP